MKKLQKLVAQRKALEAAIQQFAATKTGELSASSNAIEQTQPKTSRSTQKKEAGSLHVQPVHVQA